MTRVRQNSRALPLDKVKLKSATGVDKEVSFKTLKAQISDTVGNTIIFVDSAQTTEQVISENRRIVFCKTEDADITVKVPDAPEEGWTCQIIKYEGNFNVVVQSESGTTQIGGLGETSQTISREGDSITIMYQTSSGSPGYVIVQDSRNSNLLDGVPGSGYLRSDANDTLNAVMKVDQSTAGSIIFEHDANTGGYIPSPQGAAIHTSSSTPVTGAIKIALPANVSEDMLGFVVEIYDSATDESLTVFIKGYIHQGSGADEWKNESVYILSSATDFSRDYTVRFGNDGTNNCVWIGETSSVWSYPQVIVRDFFGGYTTDIDDYATGWDITFETAFDTIDATHSNNLVVAGDSENLAGASAAFYLDWNNFTNVPSTFTPSAHTHDASDITSGTFPDARIDSATNWNTAYNYSQIGHLPLSGGSVSGTITTSGLTATTDPIDAQGDLRGRSNFRLDSYAPASGHNLLIVGTDGTVYTRNENYYTTQNWVTSQGYQTASDVSTIIENDVDKSFVDALNVDADTLDGIDSTGFALASHTHTTSDITNLSSYTGFDTRYYTETEINNKFSGVAATSGYNKTNWDTAYGWGDHATQGYQTASDVSTIITNDVDKTFIDNLNVDADTLDGQDSTYYLAWNNLTGKPSTFTPSAHTHDAGDITSGTFPDSRIDSAANWNTAYNYSQVGHVPISQKGSANGVATLDGNGKVPLTQINDSIIGQVEYKGLWNASTNTPTLPATPTEKGHYYIVSTSGTQFGESYEVGDWIISDGSSWSKVDNTDAVSSVFGRTGNVAAVEADYQSFYPRLSQSYANPTWISSLAWSKITGVPLTFTPSAHTHTTSDITNLSSYTGFDARYYTEAEINDKFSGASATTGYNKTNWDTAFGWGNHASEGYQTAGDVATIIASDVDKAFVDALNVDADTLDGQHGSVFMRLNADNLFTDTEFQIKADTSDGSDSRRILIGSGGAIASSRGAYIGLHGNEYATDSGQLGLVAGSGSRILFSAAEYFFNNSPSVDATATQAMMLNGSSQIRLRTLNISNWDTAFGWGDHATQGYLKSADLNGYATESWVTSQGYQTAGDVATIIVSDVDKAFVDALNVDADTLDGIDSTGFALAGHTHTTSDITNLSSYTGFDTRYYTETEINNRFSGATAAAGYNKTNWDTAFGWGDHSTQNYALTTGDTFTGDVNFNGNVFFKASKNIRFYRDDNTAYVHHDSRAYNTDYAALYKFTQIDGGGYGSYVERWYSGSDYVTLGINSSEQFYTSSDIIAGGILYATGGNSTQWNTAYGWGNHAVAGYELQSNKGAANGYAPLGSDAKIPNSFLPALAITDTFVVASQAAMLALSAAEQGDVAVRTDINKSFILTDSSFGTLSSWQELLTPLDTVTSVNGLTGAVQLSLGFTPSTGVLTLTGSPSVNLGFTSSDVSNWNTAFGWGNHATQGYQTAGDVATIIVSDVDKAFVDALNIDADTLDGQNGTYYLAWNNLTGVPSTFTPSAHTHNASDVTSGTFANARISQGSVTQHEGALTINWSQLFNVPAYDNYKYWNASDGTKNFLVSANDSVTWKSGANVSVVLDDQSGEFQISATNNYVSSLSFSGGTLTLGRQGLSSLSTSLDGRYLRLSNGTNQTVTGPVTFESVVQNSVQTATASTSSYSWTPTANTLKLTVTVSTLEITLPNPANYVGDYSIILINNTSGTALSFVGTHKRPRNTVIGRTPNGTDIVSLKSDGSTWYLVLTDDWI